MRRLLVAAVASVLLLATAAAARVRLVGAEQLAHPTLLGSRVLYESQGRGTDGDVAFILTSLRPGGRRSVLVSASTGVIRTGNIQHTTGYAYAATPTHLALAELDGSNRGAKRLGSVTLSFSALDATATQTLVTCDQPVAPHPPPFAVDGPRVVYVEGACEGGPETVVVHEIGAVDVRIPVPPGDKVNGVALAGAYVAYDLEPPAGGPAPKIVVASRSSGVESFHLDGTGGPFALQGDGMLAAVASSCPDTALLTASPGAPTPTTIAGAHPCSPLRLAGGRVVYRDTAGHLHLVSPAGADETLVGAAVGDFDADTQHTVFTFPDCGGRALYRMDLAEPPSAPAVPGSCPVRVRQRTLRLRGSHIFVPLSCPKACRGDVSLTRGARLATTPIAIPDPGNARAELRLTAAARRRLGHGRLAAALVVRSLSPVAGRAFTQRVRVTVVRPG